MRSIEDLLYYCLAIFIAITGFTIAENVYELHPAYNLLYSLTTLFCVAGFLIKGIILSIDINNKKEVKIK